MLSNRAVGAGVGALVVGKGVGAGVGAVVGVAVGSNGTQSQVAFVQSHPEQSRMEREMLSCDVSRIEPFTITVVEPSSAAVETAFCSALSLRTTTADVGAGVRVGVGSGEAVGAGVRGVGTGLTDGCGVGASIGSCVGAGFGNGVGAGSGTQLDFVRSHGPLPEASQSELHQKLFAPPRMSSTR